MKDIIHPFSRRKFVKGSALAAGGLMFSPMMQARSLRYGQNPVLRLAVIGCGGRGTGAIRQALQADPDTELVAMADAFEDRLNDCYNNLSQIFDKKRLKVKDSDKYVGFDAYKKAIDQADVVILATTPGFRPVHFRYAVEQGKHVFMEKPVAVDAPGIRSVLETGRMAMEKKLCVVTGLQRHYETKYRELYKQVQDGSIGKITGGSVYWNSSGVWVRDRQPGQTEMEYQMRNWYYFNWLCGDHITEQHVHNIDVANWFLGEYPVSAQGMGGREVRNGKDTGQIFDHHFVEFKYANGAVISSQCRHQPGCWNMVNETLQGTKGSMNTGPGLIQDLDGKTLFRHDDEEDPNPYQVEHDELFAAIRRGELINNTEYTAMSTMSSILGRMATYSGTLITMEEALSKGKSIMPDESKLGFQMDPPVMPDANGYYPVPVPGTYSPLMT